MIPQKRIWILLTVLIAGVPLHGEAFSVDFGAFVPFAGNLSIGDTILDISEPVHESITRDAIKLVTPDASSRLIRHLQSGNVNADSPADHKFDHVYHMNNATVRNGRFSQSFALIQEMLDQAVAHARNNSAALHPAHNTFRGLAADVAATLTSIGLNLQCGGLGILTESACPKAQLFTAASAIAAFELVNPASPVRFAMPDPHGLNKSSVDQVRDSMVQLLDPPHKYCAPLDSHHCFNRLDDMQPNNEDFQRDVRHLRKLAKETRAYYAWQFLGHAFHTTQDFFAHSNFVELLNGQPGPPCGNVSLPICGQPILDQPGSHHATTLRPFVDLVSRGFAFNLQTLQTALGNKFPHLQTGFVNIQDTADIALNAGSKYCPEALPAGFDYCHWPKDYVPGLDKDSDEKLDEYPAHRNHIPARYAATQVSAELWRHFLVRAGFLAPPADPSRKDQLKEAIRTAKLRRIAAIILADED